MKTLFSIFDKRSEKYVWRLALIIIFILSSLLVLFNEIIILEIFYIFPIILTSWYGSKKSGILLALTAVSLIFLIEIYNNKLDSNNILGYALPLLISFLALAILITNFRNVHRVESTAADTDSLTHINNSRGFYIELANELLRSSRYQHIFSLAYIDIDNFKAINDSVGHAEGDRLLIEVAHCLKSSLRATDIVARLGGDEFACLLPETEQEEARIAFTKANALLAQKMTKGKWPVSFSIGLVTFETMPNDIKQAMKISDDLMYSVKNADKNNISYKIWHGKS